MLWIILRESLATTLIGTMIGVPVALAASRLIASQLYGVTPADASTGIADILILAFVGAVAGFLPAYRAARIYPLAALRYE